MIYVSSALKQKEITELLEKYEGDYSFKFVEKKGIKLSFEIIGGDEQVAINQAKAIIKGTDFGKALYFQVTA